MLSCPLVEVYRLSLLSRRFEERVARLALEGFLPPMLHPGAGHEVSQIAALAALRPLDPVIYSHRGLAYMVARGVSLQAILCDIAGRVGGTNNGKGGIMHVVDPSRGIYGESGTLGGGLVVATGMGMALQKKKSDALVVHFFGDGGSNRGPFHESLNWAAVQKLPVIFVCENNGWAVSVPASRSTAVEDISLRAIGYGIPGHIVQGDDPEQVFATFAQAADRARAGQGPSLIEIKAVRLLGHYSTDPQDYRSDVASASEKDPLPKLADMLLAQGLADTAALSAMEQEIERQIADAVAQARQAPLIDAREAMTDLFA
ncbi:thiamine pyrophosphate-dependent dehydrogenase E1 component subunit alpha [Sphingobium sp. CR2-8]|uniref:thiamine pyrophosphate-dependent dehydrogenase E1 component subunit alpha n=1 Tax=Sphingobium sp. CR2-8 TaxID=1306534 RepID=UPI002DB67043|nr:thiamine pyrophosphate-dependent dehydrogenase E1 component subunit alpha [Sphingobium sp. CR2-8]MEC3909398.1 thiamine pyrophosphate-dependent dehydrogenase E1 component subunit alpha [Sphingobium sp. CR2-8]